MPASEPTVVYTDGACSGNPGPGGWAWAIPGGRYATGFEAHSTNQRMEIKAALEAVRSIPGRLDVVSDSTYVVHCFRDRWHEGWVKRGWRNSQRQPVANRDLWEPLIDLVLRRGDVTFRWVKGHSGDPNNDLVDRLAVEAATNQRSRSGEGEPSSLGPADSPSGPLAPAQAAGSGRDRRLPDGRLVLVSGHRPSELGGYGPNAQADAVRGRLAEAFEAMVQIDGRFSVVSGLQLGSEQLGAEAALSVGLPLVVVLPFPHAERPWPTESRARFAKLVSAAELVITLGDKEPVSRQAAGAALGRHIGWLAKQVDAAVVVWDQEDDLVGRSVRSLEEHLGADQVLLVNP